MEANKELVINALRKWIAQRPGLEFGNYGDASAYRSEMRSITKDRHHAEQLLGQVAWRDSITGAQIIEAAKHAYSGRLSITVCDGSVTIDYCTGQYWPTEYRRAVCAVLAAVLWDYWRDNMPAATGKKYLRNSEGKEIGSVDLHGGLSPGDWLRKKAKQELGRSVGSRWFN